MLIVEPSQKSDFVKEMNVPSVNIIPASTNEVTMWKNSKAKEHPSKSDFVAICLEKKITNVFYGANI